ncbi:esterase family protein [Mycolicibacterium madagascariense]|nr:esterase family protein [Mycolicibacterium madagascariense]
MDGWLPVTAQVVTAVLLFAAVGYRSRRWLVVGMPALVALGVAAALVAHSVFTTLGLASEPAPLALWVWVALTALALGNLVAGWRGDGWARRNLCALATSLCLLSTGLTINGWIGYFPTVYTAWNQLTSGPLPDETDWAAVRERQRVADGSGPGAVLKIDTGSAASGFTHRTEYVYLPPAWFRTTPPPPLPTVMMIGGQFNTPGDWLRAGDAVATLDAFATQHGGNAPVAVFVDPNGSFANDTECVNGSRGNAADHLTKDVVPHVIAAFGTSPRRSDWGVVGFSSGGTCAVDLTVMHPELFSAFVDVAGDLGPNAGDREQTIDRLFGGDAQAWSRFDPVTAMARHGRYTGVAGLFVVPEPDEKSARIARTLCDAGTAQGITCAVVARPGRHVWPFGSTAFATTLPWLAATIRTPGVPPAPVP